MRRPYLFVVFMRCVEYIIAFIILDNSYQTNPNPSCNLEFDLDGSGMYNSKTGNYSYSHMTWMQHYNNTLNNWQEVMQLYTGFKPQPDHQGYLLVLCFMCWWRFSLKRLFQRQKVFVRFLVPCSAGRSTHRRRFVFSRSVILIKTQSGAVQLIWIAKWKAAWGETRSHTCYLERERDTECVYFNV